MLLLWQQIGHVDVNFVIRLVNRFVDRRRPVISCLEWELFEDFANRFHKEIDFLHGRIPDDQDEESD